MHIYAKELSQFILQSFREKRYILQDIISDGRCGGSDKLLVELERSLFKQSFNSRYHRWLLFVRHDTKMSTSSTIATIENSHCTCSAIRGQDIRSKRRRVITIVYFEETYVYRMLQYHIQTSVDRDTWRFVCYLHDFMEEGPNGVPLSLISPILLVIG